MGMSDLRRCLKRAKMISSIAILVAGFGVPVLMTVLGHVPIVSGWMHRLKPYLAWPSIISRYHVRPLPYLLGNAPTAGQALYIAMFIILNIVLTAAGYESHQPNAWNPTVWKEITAYLITRTGVLAYIFMPLIFLFSSRNNVLLWMTNWSHSTFLVLHRWLARVFTFQAVLHSIIAVVSYKRKGTFEMNQVMSYWIWGEHNVVELVQTIYRS